MNYPARAVLLVLLVAPGLMAFSPIQGTFKVLEPMKIKDRKDIQVPVGQYKANMEPGLFDHYLIFEFTNASGKKEKITFSFPRGEEFPTDGGRFELLGTEIKQDFDLLGDLNVGVTQGPQTREIESCIYYQREQVCDNHNGQYSCHYEDVAYPGRREVVYHIETKTYSMDAQFNQMGTQQELASFEGFQTERRTVYDYVGRCYRY